MFGGGAGTGGRSGQASLRKGLCKKVKEARERAMHVAVGGKSVVYMGLFCRRKIAG